MNKSLLQKYWVNLGLIITFILVFITGIIKLPIIITKLDFNKSTLFTLMRMHDISGVLMGLLVLIHIIQNWKWIIFITKNIFKKK